MPGKVEVVALRGKEKRKNGKGERENQFALDSTSKNLRGGGGEKPQLAAREKVHQNDRNLARSY